VWFNFIRVLSLALALALRTVTAHTKLLPHAAFPLNDRPMLLSLSHLTARLRRGASLTCTVLECGSAASLLQVRVSESLGKGFRLQLLCAAGRLVLTPSLKMLAVPACVQRVTAKGGPEGISTRLLYYCRCSRPARSSTRTSS